MAVDARWLLLSKPLRAPLRDGTTVLASSLVQALPDEIDVAYLGDPETPLRPGHDRVLPALAVGYAPGFLDRARLLMTLVDPRLRKLGVHLFFSPNRASQTVLAGVRRTAPGRRFVQTIPASDGAEAHAAALRGLDAVVVTSDHARSKLIGCGLADDRVHTIHPGIAIPKHAERDPASSKRLLYAGDLDEAAAGRLLVLARLLRRPELAGWKLTIAARPKSPEDARARATVRRELAGDLADGRVELAAEVADMDALLRSSALLVYLADHVKKKVDLPLVLLEGLARGIGVAALDIDPLAEIFGIADAERLEVGMRLSPRDPERAAQTLVTAVTDPARLRKWGADARTLAERRFSAARMAAQYLELYAALERAP
ncbi:MAG TPA: glycosyltransferase [Nannocystaceae bacterium]|nr:glycosyltransferase [Nannocystaceae bacterium]